MQVPSRQVNSSSRHLGGWVTPLSVIFNIFNLFLNNISLLTTQDKLDALRQYNWIDFGFFFFFNTMQIKETKHFQRLIVNSRERVFLWILECFEEKRKRDKEFQKDPEHWKSTISNRFETVWKPLLQSRSSLPSWQSMLLSQKKFLLMHTLLSHGNWPSGHSEKTGDN